MTPPASAHEMVRDSIKRDADKGMDTNGARLRDSIKRDAGKGVDAE